MKVVVQSTPHNSIRVFIYYDYDNLEIFQHEETKLFEALSIWRGADKYEEGMISFELSTTLLPFLLERFGRREEYEFINLKKE